MHALAALTWDPQIRGALIVLVAILVLPGSVFLLLATNLGSRLGFLVAAACLTGWLACLGLVWTVYGIGDKGPDPSWKPVAVVQGDLGQTARPPLDAFPQGWKELPDGNPKRAEAQATVDETLVNDTQAQRFGFKKFEKTADYLAVKAYDKGGARHDLFGIRLFNKGLTYKHDPHYSVIQIQPTLAQVAVAGQAPPTPKIDPAKPVFTVLLVRDLGAKRLPAFLIFWAAAILFGVTLSALHRRDRIAMAARGVLPSGAG